MVRRDRLKRTAAPERSDWLLLEWCLLTDEALRSWLARDDSSSYAVWDRELDSDGWGALANAWNRREAIVKSQSDEYQDARRWMSDKRKDVAVPDWLDRFTVMSPRHPWTIRDVRSYTSHDKKHLLSGRLMVSQMFDSHRICHHLLTIKERDLEDALTAEVIEVLRRIYAVERPLAEAFAALPWSCISMHEASPGVRGVLNAGGNVSAAAEAFQFVDDYGCAIDDNSSNHIPATRAWWDRFTQGEEGWFGYSIERAFTSFHEPDLLRKYAHYLANAVDCFDPAVEENVEAIASLRQGAYGSYSAIWFDPADVHRLVADRAADYAAAVQRLAQLETECESFDFRNQRAVPLSPPW